MKSSCLAWYNHIGLVYPRKAKDDDMPERRKQHDNSDTVFTKSAYSSYSSGSRFLCFTPYRMKALSAMNLHTSRKHEAGLILFVTSIFGVLALTLWPTYIWMDSPGVWGDIRILIDRPTWKSNLSLIPFTVFKDYIEDLFKSPVFFFATLINFFGNLAIFVPIGFFPALLFRDANWKRSAIIGFGMSALIELAQYFIMRNVAVDDIILNTAGAICGYLLYLFIRKHWTNFTDGFLCREVSKG